MTSTPHKPGKDEIADRFERYLLGQLDDQAITQLEDDLLAAPDQARACAEVIDTVALVREQFRDSQEQAGELSKDPTLNEFHDLLAELNQPGQADAPAGPVSFQAFLDEQAQKAARRRWFKIRLYLGSALAAVLVLGITLGLVISALNAPPPTAQTTSNTPPNTPNTPKPAESAQPIPRDTVATSNLIVATLTAEHNAVWDIPGAEGALAPGSNLHPGTRLTLTAGFAEITTARGAIAIIQAPATIELTDNNNAIELHSGKLVGICETSSSKGFVVRTPHMDITDRGTRFGVDASARQTVLNVYEGKVVAALPGSDGGSESGHATVTQGQALRSSADQPELTEEQPDRLAFAAALTLNALPSTGLALAEGAVDPNWRITAINGQRLDEPLQLVRSEDIGHNKEKPNDPLAGQWLFYHDASRDPGRVGMNTTYTLTTEMVIPPGTDLAATALRNICYVDNALNAVRINGQVVTGLIARSDRMTRDIVNTPRLETLGLTHGRNTLAFDIANKTATPMGLYFEMQLIDNPAPKTPAPTP